MTNKQRSYLVIHPVSGQILRRRTFAIHNRRYRYGLHGFLASLMASTKLFHPWALGMASGVGKI